MAMSNRLDEPVEFSRFHKAVEVAKGILPFSSLARWVVGDGSPPSTAELMADVLTLGEANLSHVILPVKGVIKARLATNALKEGKDYVPVNVGDQDFIKVFRPYNTGELRLYPRPLKTVIDLSDFVEDKLDDVMIRRGPLDETASSYFLPSEKLVHVSGGNILGYDRDIAHETTHAAAFKLGGPQGTNIDATLHAINQDEGLLEAYRQIYHTLDEQGGGPFYIENVDDLREYSLWLLYQRKLGEMTAKKAELYIRPEEVLPGLPLSPDVKHAPVDMMESLKGHKFIEENLDPDFFWR